MLGPELHLTIQEYYGGSGEGGEGWGEQFEAKELKLLGSLVCLHWGNSDFNLKINKDFMSGIPFRWYGDTATVLNAKNYKFL